MLPETLIPADRPLEVPESPQVKATLYVELEAELKHRFDRLAQARRRKLTAEVAIMIERYLAEEEPREGLTGEEED
jgi:hypothetical protein